MSICISSYPVAAVVGSSSSEMSTTTDLGMTCYFHLPPPSGVLDPPDSILTLGRSPVFPPANRNMLSELDAMARALLM